MTTDCEHNACQSVRLTYADVRLVETTGHGPNGQTDYPVTDVFAGERYLGAIRDDGYRVRADGSWVTRLVVFAGGQCVSLPECAWDPEANGWARRTDESMSATVSEFVKWLNHVSFSWRMALHG